MSATTTPLLSIEHVSKTYWRGPHELRVLRDVSLDVYPGDFIAIYGQRSAGKTTLLTLAAGYESPDDGSVRFDGHDLNALPRERLAELHLREIGLVHRAGPQSQDLRVIEHVAMALLRDLGHHEAHKRAKTALAHVGVAECAFEKWTTLSDAERMSVAVAQAIVRKPRLLLVDDPTAGLDVLERERLVALLRATADDAKVGVLMAVPDLPAMMRAHDVRSLSDGQLLAPDPPPGGRGKLIDFPGGERSA
jgi:ABC-type lipoprotein export system ATPase subunit